MLLSSKTRRCAKDHLREALELAFFRHCDHFRINPSLHASEILALAATIIEWQHDRIKALERPHGDGSAIVTLSPENSDAFLAHCENPAPPNEALRELVRKVRVAKGLSRATLEED
jgi:hypothetical protein